MEEGQRKEKRGRGRREERRGRRDGARTEEGQRKEGGGRREKGATREEGGRGRMPTSKPLPGPPPEKPLVRLPPPLDHLRTAGRRDSQSLGALLRTSGAISPPPPFRPHAHLPQSRPPPHSQRRPSCARRRPPARHRARGPREHGGARHGGRPPADEGGPRPGARLPPRGLLDAPPPAPGAPAPLRRVPPRPPRGPAAGRDARSPRGGPIGGQRGLHSNECGGLCRFGLGRAGCSARAGSVAGFVRRCLDLDGSWHRACVAQVLR